jgi:hypothetical protein
MNPPPNPVNNFYEKAIYNPENNLPDVLNPHETLENIEA